MATETRRCSREHVRVHQIGETEGRCEVGPPCTCDSSRKDSWEEGSLLSYGMAAVAPGF